MLFNEERFRKYFHQLEIEMQLLVKSSQAIRER